MVEWFRQLLLANNFHRKATDRCEQAQLLAQQEGVFPFVIPVPDLPTAYPAFQVEYRDSDCAIARVFPEPAAR